MLAIPHRYGTYRRRHTELGDHPPGDRRRSLDVVAGSGRDLLLSEDQLLRHAATEQHLELPQQPHPRIVVPILLRKRRGEPQRPTAGDDRHLVEWVETGHPQADDRVSGLVVRGDLPLILRDHEALALGAEHDLVLRLLEVLHVDAVLVLPGSEQRGFVHDVLDVRAREAGRALREDDDVHVVGDRDVPRVYPEDSLPTPHIGTIHHDLPVKPSRTEQRGIQHVGPVRRGEQNDAFVRLEAVHLYQKLVQGLLPLVVPAAEPRAAVSSDRVDLIDEDDAGRVGLALLEKIPHPARADPDEHLHEVRSGHGEEGTGGLARYGPGHQRLPGPGRPDEQRALGQPPAQTAELGRILEELDDLLKLLLGLVAPGHVCERHLRRVTGEELRLGLAETEGPRAAALHLAEEEDPEPDDEEPGEDADEHGDPVAAGTLPAGLDARLLQLIDERLVRLVREERVEALDLKPVPLDRRTQLALELAALLDRDPHYVSALDLGPELGVRQLLLSLPAAVHELEDQQRYEHDQSPEGGRPEEAVHAPSVRAFGTLR